MKCCEVFCWSTTQVRAADKPVPLCLACQVEELGLGINVGAVSQGLIHILLCQLMRKSLLRLLILKSLLRQLRLKMLYSLRLKRLCLGLGGALRRGDGCCWRKLRNRWKISC